MKQPPQFERQALEQMAPSLLVEIILRQQEATQQLFEEVARLKAIINRNSSDSSKPPSSDFLKKSEKAKVEPLDEGKRKAGGQPGHQGTTRKGFERDKSEQWWYFLKDPKIPPDNNRAERNLRLAVTKRKVCGGSRSMDGLDDTAALLTVIQTCKAQGKSAVEFFWQALIDPTELTLIPPQT
jgi:Family of unknown function (DUF6444)/Transposase IS66 family